MQYRACSCNTSMHNTFLPPLSLTSEELQVLLEPIQGKVHCTTGEDTWGKLLAGDVQGREVQQLHTHTQVR